MKTYDFRSDTITRPTAGMRKAMAEAEVGDDVYAEDPSINRLQERAAELTGKEAALFVSSGSMGNLIPIFINCGRGREVLCHKDSHIIHHELSSGSALAGAALIGLEGARGKLTPETLAPAVRHGGYDSCRTGMIELENTIAGVYYRRAELEAVSGFAQTHSLQVHIDGARLFNAALASGLSVSEISGYADTVTFCLSKGLGAPVGSCLCGSREFIAEARRIRKMLGGGMRQAGIIAAAGLYALENHVTRLAEDHAGAAKIAAALAETTWARVDPTEVETNIIFFDTVGIQAEEIVGRLAEKGLLCFSDGQSTIRMVVSLAVDETDIEKTCGIIRDL